MGAAVFWPYDLGFCPVIAAMPTLPLFEPDWPRKQGLALALAWHHAGRGAGGRCAGFGLPTAQAAVSCQRRAARWLRQQLPRQTHP